MFDQAMEIDLRCPYCGQTFREAVGKLREEPRFPCPGCGSRFSAEKLVESLAETEKTLAGLEKKLGPDHVDVKVTFRSKR
jgi:transposase-like protein